MKQYTYKENDTSLSHSSDPIRDIPNVAIKVNWNEIEKILHKEIPFSEKKAFIAQYGNYIKTLDAIQTWRRIVIVCGTAADIAVGAIEGIFRGTTTLTTTLVIITLSIAAILIIVEVFYKNYFIKKFKSSSKMIETTQMVRESIIDYVKEPTVAAIKKASLVILPMLQSIWDYFFGAKDEVFSDLTIRRRRQLVLFGVILIIGLMSYVFR